MYNTLYMTLTLETNQILLTIEWINKIMIYFQNEKLYRNENE